MLHEKAGNNEKAILYMNNVLKIDPDYPNALNFIGYTWADQGINLERAEEMVRRAIAKKPDDGYIMDSMGWIYYRKGDYDSALKELLKAHQKLPDDPTIAEHVGDVYTALKEYGMAIEYFEKSMKLEKKEEKIRIIEKKIKAIEEKRK